MNRTSRLRVIGIVVPLLPVLALLGALVAWWGSLPDPIASHWGFGGEPDDSFGRAGFAAVMLVLVVGGGLGAFLVSRRPQPATGAMSGPLALVTFLQWTFAGVAFSAIVANVDAATWEQADDLSMAIVALIVVAAAGVAAAVGGMARSIEHRVASPAESVPSAGLAAGERAVWIGGISVRWPLLLGAVLALAGVGVTLAVGLGPGLVLIAAALPILSFASIRVLVDRRGLTVQYGPFGWPRTKIPLEQVAEARTVEVTGASHGGWGYRGSLRVLGRASLVLRAGDGIHVDLRDGKRFVVTVDDADTAAGTLNDLAGANAP